MTPPTDATATGLKEAIAWLRECSDWLLTNDLDMSCPMQTDPLDIADNLEALLPSASVGGEREAERARCAAIADRMQAAAWAVLQDRHNDDAAVQCDTASEIAKAIRDPEYEREALALATPETPPTETVPTPPALSEDLRGVLEFYADRDGDGYRVDVTNYGLSTEEGDIVRDGGERARAALALTNAQGQAS